jgi:tetratricopeptide (TPR) repeat protein
MELERIGGPETTGRSLADLVTAASIAFKQGRRWEAYALARDAAPLSATSPPMTGFGNVAEQAACLNMNVATIAGALGKLVFSIHELESVRSSGSLGPVYSPVVLECLASRFLAQGHNEKARQLAEAAIEAAEACPSHPYLGNIYNSRARVAGQESDLVGSIDFYQKAYKCFSEAGRQLECANTLTNLSQMYFDAGRVGAARRAISSADRIASSVDHQGVRSRVRILLGEIEAGIGKHERAADLWRDAIAIARRINDKTLHFKAEFRLYEQAVSLGRDSIAAAFERRLLKLASWIPPHVEELRAFKTLSEARPRSPRSVARAQRTQRPGRNSSRSALLM